MADRTLKIDPPSDDYIFVGYTCIYHIPRGWCHNPLDCDLVPMYRLNDDVARRLMVDDEHCDPEGTRRLRNRMRKEGNR